INVDKDFYEKHFNVYYFLNNFYIKFSYKEECIYHTFENLKSVKEYIKLKWAVINSKHEALNEIFIDNEIHVSVDSHWALKESFFKNENDFVSLLSQRRSLDLESIDPTTKYILEKCKPS
ncbi:hypothetical protein EBU94_04400, partial [bacterium]|nr:hypothetical protein [bacterium]